MVDERGVINEDKLISHGYGPGYRDFYFQVVTAEGQKFRIDLSVDDGLNLVREIMNMHDIAWRGGSPLDVAEHEVMPTWVKEYFTSAKVGRAFKRE